MIKKFFPTEFDLFNLSLKRTVAPATSVDIDYKDVVVNKPWGYEYLLFENKRVAIWILFLKKDAKTSMHCHPKKKTSLLVLEGKVRTSSLHTQFDLDTLDSLMIDKGVFHSTASTSEEGSFIMEIESPPAKSDLVRLKDEYGRENQGYEGEHKFSRDLEKYEYHNFHGHDSVIERNLTKKILNQKRTIVFHANENWDNLKEELKNNQVSIISFLDTDIEDKKGNIILDAGDICEGVWFMDQFNYLQPKADTFTVLTIY